MTPPPPIKAFQLLNSSDNSEMGRIEACPSMEEGVLPPQSTKDDSRQSDESDYNNNDDVGELRTQLREKDTQVMTLTADKAVCMQQIIDLKNQLYQLASFSFTPLRVYVMCV